MKKWLYRIVLISLLLSLAGCYSCKTWNNFWDKGPVEPAGAEKPFWSDECRPIEPAPPKSAPTPK